MQPDTSPLIADSAGDYQWDTLPGSYRVHVEAPGYYPADSIMVAVPPPVFTLNVGLTRIPDSLAPVTTASLSGTPGNNGWYTSDVQVSLSAVDEAGGTGLDYTEYSYDGAHWTGYTAPLEALPATE